MINKPFWGNIYGSELARNEKANEILKKFLDECVWINLHMLPHSSRTLEVKKIKNFRLETLMGMESDGSLMENSEDS